MSDKTPAERLRTEIAIQREAIADLPDDDDERGLQAVLDDIEAVLDDNDRLNNAVRRLRLDAEGLVRMLKEIPTKATPS